MGEKQTQQRKKQVKKPWEGGGGESVWLLRTAPASVAKVREGKERWKARP